MENDNEEESLVVELSAYDTARMAAYDRAITAQTTSSALSSQHQDVMTGKPGTLAAGTPASSVSGRQERHTDMPAAGKTGPLIAPAHSSPTCPLYAAVVMNTGTGSNSVTPNGVSSNNATPESSILQLFLLSPVFANCTAPCVINRPVNLTVSYTRGYNSV